jgi:hypothetical protein
MPWPISALPTTTVTVSSGATRTKALGASVAPVRAAPPPRSLATRMPTYRLAPTTALAMRKWRRAIGVSLMARSWCLRRC